ncbi:MAG: hypothetical protein J6O41_00510 [Clostridia bacterium]|nr:hypothetical protein [Clostridia bacterium]
MKMLKNEIDSFLEDIEKNIKNKEDLLYIKQRFTSFINDMTNSQKKLNNLEERQIQLEEKINNIQRTLDNIEKDIYSDDAFDFEIVCPYCDNEFIIDIDENKTEIECPNCKNVIELDWTGDLDEEYNQNFGCPGCGGCKRFDEDDDM